MERCKNVTASTTETSKQNRPENGTELLPDRLQEIRDYKIIPMQRDLRHRGASNENPAAVGLGIRLDEVEAPADIAWLLDEVERLRGEA